ncbi:MAG TPA: aminotransferase class I/II-fold pyridoxal phosphate-dependent enzyme [Ktedonobacterales bacterium]
MSDEDLFIPPIEEDRFWALVEMSGGDADKMQSILLWFPKEDSIAFDLRLGESYSRLDRDDIHAVTGGSDDGFLYIRLWIVSQGREYYEAVLADPSKAQDHENEQFLYSAMDAYEALGGEETWSDIVDKHWNAYRTSHSTESSDQSGSIVKQETKALNGEREESTMRLASRMERLGTETAFEVLAKAKALETQGRSIIHLEIGEPDFPTPEHIVEAGCQALRDGYTHYTPAPGIPELREAIAADATARRGVEFSSEDVVVTPGGKPVMFYALLALVDEGDEVIYPNPGFPIYESMIRFAGGKATPIQMEEARDFSLDVGKLCDMIGPQTRMVVLNSPHNPTGGVLSRSDLEAIAEAVLRQPETLVLADEIYSRMLYEGEHTSIAALPGMRERTIVLDGFSKIYAMTGWRLGYGLLPHELVAPIVRLLINSASCTAAATQMAGVAALTGSQAPSEAMVEEFRRRREVIIRGLNAIPRLSAKTPHGAFYAFPNITETGMTSRQMADLLLNEAGVAALSGTAFGAYGEGYIRLSYANSVEQIEEALDRIRRTLAEHP